MKTFVEECLDREIMMTKFLKHEIYRTFKTYCERGEFPFESEQSFSRKMKKECGFQYKQIANGKAIKEYYWIGIKVRNGNILNKVNINLKHSS